MFNLIKDNEIDHLREVLYNYYPYQQSLGKIRWTESESLSFTAQNKTYNITGGNDITALILAIKSKSLACTKLIVENYKSKEQYQYGNWAVNEYSFSTLVLPMILQTKDLEALNFLVKQTSFNVSLGDVENFVNIALELNWA